MAASVPKVTESPVATPVPAPTPDYDEVGDPKKHLADGVEERERRRARLARAGALYWDLDAAEQEKADVPATESKHIEGTEVVVVERHPEHLRVLYDGNGIRLLAYLRVGDFMELPARDVTLLTPDGEPFANECGVTIAAGDTDLELRPASLGYWRAGIDQDGLSAKGLLRDDAVDRVYRLGDAAKDLLPELDCAVTPPVTVRDGPGGRVVAELAEEHFWPCQALPSSGADTKKVRIYRGTTTIVGFVPVAAFESDEIGGGLGLSGIGTGGWRTSHATYAYLWPGDLFYTSKGDGPVGSVTRRAFRVSVQGEREGKRLVRFPISPWGFRTFVIEPSTYEAAAKKHAAWMGRVGFENLSATAGAKEADVRNQIEGDRSGLNGCYDRALEKMPGASFTYDVDLDFATRKAKLVAIGPTRNALESCLEIWLSTSHPKLKGGKATFRLTLKPAPIVDAVDGN
jgi:hypothetical protein